MVEGDVGRPAEPPCFYDWKDWRDRIFRPSRREGESSSKVVVVGSNDCFACMTGGRGRIFFPAPKSQF